MMILIGEQASGKSTIAKTIFFCKSISDEFKLYVINQENIAPSYYQTTYIGFLKVLKKIIEKLLRRAEKVDRWMKVWCEVQRS